MKSQVEVNDGDVSTVHGKGWAIVNYLIADADGRQTDDFAFVKRGSSRKVWARRDNRRWKSPIFVTVPFAFHHEVGEGVINLFFKVSIAVPP